MVNVPLVVNVWMVCPPLVVIVQPVDVGETQSEPFVAYDMITIPEPQFHPFQFHPDPPPPPQPVFAVAFVPAHPAASPPLPPPPEPHVPFRSKYGVRLYPPPPPPPAYVTDAPDIELAVPAPQLPA